VTEKSSDYLKRVYAAQTNRDLTDAYDQWADEYDEHVTGFGYKSPAVAAGLFGRYVRPSDDPVLDAGCGTGLVGELLHIMGYQYVVGIDLSKGMLEKARTRNAYAELRQMVLGEPLDLPDNHFGACVSVGVFTAGHAPASAFDELVRTVKTGGYIIFSLRKDVYEEGGYRATFDSLVAAGKWRLVEMTDPFAALPYEDMNIQCSVFAFQVL
jgi:predicted TPR repeat methyltransferase